jgi:hypothetical protein
LMSNWLSTTRELDMSKRDLVTRMALIANGIGMIVIYPMNMIVLERASWIWDYPNRHPAFEHMLVAIFVSMGAFLIWAARDPVRFLPFIDFVIVSGAIHGTAMAIDAWHMPGMASHLAFRGDVMGTYFAPVTLALTHPRLFYLFKPRTA